MAFNLLLLVRLPDLHRAAVQQVRAARRRDAEGARAGADAALRLRRQGPVRDGRQQALRPCQRLLHRLRRGQARGLLRHAAAAPVARRGRRGAGARTGPLQAQAHASSASPACSRFSLAGFALLGWLSTQQLVLHRPGRARRTWARPTTRWRCCCSCWRCRCSPSSSRRCWRSFSRQHEFEADAYACAQTSGARPGHRAAQAVRGQRVDADARPGVRAVLLLAPAGLRAAGAR